MNIHVMSCHVGGALAAAAVLVAGATGAQYTTLFLVDLSDLRIRFNTKPSLVYQSSSELRGRTPASDRPPIPALQVYSRPEQEVTVGGAYQSVQSLRV